MARPPRGAPILAAPPPPQAPDALGPGPAAPAAPPQQPAPPTDPLKGITPKALTEAIKRGHEVLKPFRDRRTEAVGEFQGSRYGKGDTEQRPVNLIAQAVSILIPQLISRNPKHRVDSPLYPDEAEKLALALDDTTDKLELVHVYRRAVLDAILGPFSVVKVGERAGDERVKVHDSLVCKGEPYVGNIDLEDFAADPSATTRRERRWEAHRYRMSEDEALQAVDDGIFGRDPVMLAMTGDVPDPRVATPEEAKDIIRGMKPLGDSTEQDKQAEDYRLVKTLVFWDVVFYSADGAKLITVPGAPGEQAQPTSDKFLSMEPYEGAERGPYEILEFNPVPGKAVGIAPVAMWWDIHDLAKKVSAKMGRMAMVTKTAHVYRKGEEDLALALKKAKNDEWIPGDPEAIKDVQIGGILKDLYEFVNVTKAWWGDASGNLALVGGQDSEASTGTATAASMLQANSSTRTEDMRDQVVEFAIRCARRLAWMLITDPLINLPVPYRLPGGETVTLKYDAATRQGAFADFNFKIDQTSMRMGVDPMIRARRIVDMLAAFAQQLPLVQAGIIDPLQLLRVLGREFDVDDLESIVARNALVPLQAQALGAVPGPAQGQPQGRVPNGAGPFPFPQPGNGIPGSQSSTPVDQIRSAAAPGVPGQ